MCSGTSPVTVRDRRNGQVRKVTVDRANGVAVDQAELRSQYQKRPGGPRSALG
jgi:hypothetical protein